MSPINLNAPDYDRPSKFMQEGWNTCTIIKFNMGQTPSKRTPYVEYVFRDEEGREKEEWFYHEHPKMRWRLRHLARACGLREDQVNSFDFEDLVGRGVDVLYEKDKKQPEFLVMAMDGFALAGTGGTQASATPANGQRLDDKARAMAHAASDDSEIPF